MDVFVLKDSENQLFKPSLQATILAKYSRSPESARSISKTVTGTDADNFGEKWVINYGHSSVAELATIPVCFENVSMIASKFIESFQRAGYSEKSTRYQRFCIDSFIDPDLVPGVATNFVRRFFEAYENMNERMTCIVLEKMNLEDTHQNRNLAKVKARVFDNLRYLLPAGTGTNLAAVMNLRDIRYLISQGRSSDNLEIRQLAEATHRAVSHDCPTFVKDANPSDFDIAIKSFSRLNQLKEGAHLLSIENEAVTRLKDEVCNLYGMEWDSFQEHLHRRKNEQMPAVFKTIKLKYLLVMDYGAYRDLQRHRRCEQYSELFTPWIGFSTPDDIRGTDLEEQYIRVMESVKIFDHEIANDPQKVQYITPMGYLHRSIFQMDLRELYYICELRTKPQGHISYRRIAYEMFEVAKAQIPELMQWCRATKPIEIGDHL